VQDNQIRIRRIPDALRRANVYGLEWSQVDLKRGVALVHADQAKARRAIGVPLNEDAVEVIRKQLGKHLRRVFVGPDGGQIDTWHTYPAQQAWVAGCKRSGIENFRWHDLRHTWASWHVQLGTAIRAEGAWRLADAGNGEPIRSPGPRASQDARGAVKPYGTNPSQR
jgi:integrase